ncbi:uncharacterized protein Ecym_7067 [Eremothecium cymbalariae DBVPG|uniref:AB hydrolase-1 domain-containing protein n=1 Tax=Eremothecium cymbalariae (strain CBS 270.75 / DBVPG 7215 / KCTC 17166 / NRRL Y-17582) TaxID=931890 RepID=G8JVQ5_ERECY|nr:hypothetical protein Ecym_7067 [Eremothecium cymbalariae DBVPG\
MNLPIINPFNWGIRGTVSQHLWNNDRVSLTLKDSRIVTLDKFVNENVPGLKDGARFNLKPYLFTGILQTFYLGAADFSNKFTEFYGREIVHYSDGGVSAADWAMNEWKKSYALENTGQFNKQRFEEDAAKTHPDNWPRLHPRTRYLSEEELNEVHNDTRPLIVIQHGLAGGSHEPVIRCLVKDLMELGRFNVVVLAARGCARTKVTVKKLFDMVSTDDLREFIRREHERIPGRKIYGVGFSFGATLIANYLGEEGTDCPLSGVVCLSNPWNMAASSQKMENDFWSKKLFSKAIVNFLFRTVKANMAELEYNEKVDGPSFLGNHKKPSPHVFTNSNLEMAKNCSSVVEFDEIYAAPASGFKTALDYYKSGASLNRLGKIRVPTLVINSYDDPLTGHESIPIKEAEANSNILLCTTDLGGHLAYLDANDNSWVTQQITHFFDRLDALTV